MNRSFPAESFQMVHTRLVPLCLLKNCTLPFAGKFFRFFHTIGKYSDITGKNKQQWSASDFVEEYSTKESRVVLLYRFCVLFWNSSS